MAIEFKLPDFMASMKAASEASDKPLPFIGHLPFAKQMQILGGGAALALVLSVISAGLDYRSTSHGQHYLNLSGDLVMLTQRIAKDAGSAMQGKQTAIEGLPQSRGDAERILTALDQGDDVAPATSGASREVLDRLLPIAKQSFDYIRDIEDGRPALLTVSRAVQAVEEVGPDMREAVSQLPPGERTTRFALLIERLGKDANAMMGRVVTTEMVAALGSDTNEASGLLAGFDQSNPAVARVADLYEGYRNSIYAVISQVQGLFAAKRGMDAYFDNASVTNRGALITTAEELKAAYASSLTGRWTTFALLLSGALLLLSLALLARLYLTEARHRAALAEASNTKNQRAILRLMNELSELADGDLTVRATVSEDITGAIADSVNYTAEELHKLVTRITDASGQMNIASKDAERLSKTLQEATVKQVEEIKEAEMSVKLITQSIAEVDAAAAKAAEVGRHTLEATNQGALAVRNTISGMDAIREHIQETSKRIKRLGESSQEIGEIVDLISDITEQTNVLALNAAIQAAAAGEAGRGFSVVAEEVQRLAERSAEATKQIGALVKTIQGDTYDAVAAMEKSTMEVVEGAKLSEVSGHSLQEIERVSNELATLINSISVSTQVQTEMAVEVAGVMRDIMQITEQTATDTLQTSESAAKVNSMAAGLMGSVAGFKL